MIETIPMMALVIIPKNAFIKWLTDTITMLEVRLPAETGKIEDIDFYKDSIVFAIPPFTDTENYNVFIQKYYKAIFINVLNSWCEDIRCWPTNESDDLPYALFKEFFDLELHSRLYRINERK